MTVGQRIRMWRIAKGMTQFELAKKVGTSKQNISRYEQDAIKDIPMRSIARVAEALGTTPADLLGFGKDTQLETIEYDMKQNELKKKKQALITYVENAPEEMLDLIESLLSMPPQQLQALATLTGLSKQNKDS